MDCLVNQIIDYIKINRVSTTEVADCLGKKGVIPDVYSVNKGNFAVGKVKWVYGFKESNYSIHEQIENTPKYSVVIVDGFDVNDKALVGELTVKFLTLYRQAASVVVIGNIRDAHNIIKQNYPVWSKGFTPIGCIKEKQNLNDAISKQILINKEKYEDSIAVCDDTGVVIIPKEYHTEEFLNKLKFIESQEDIWFDCIDRKKMTTFETVCLQKYNKNKIDELIRSDFSLDENDISEIEQRYSKRYKVNGYSPLSLGWGKGRQNLRFKNLTAYFDLKNKSILDIGCGFGDINAWFADNNINGYKYYGIDIVNEFINEANKRYGNENIKFICDEFLQRKFDCSFDYIIESGIFNYNIRGMDNYDFINQTMKKAFSLCNCAISFDFLSDKVDYKQENSFHSSPSKILEMAYELSSKVVLNNLYMPFEFSITIYKNQEIDFNKMCYKEYSYIN